MKPRLSAAMGFGLAGLTVAAVIISFLVWLARGMLDLPVSFGRTPIGVFGLVISPIAYAAVGGVLAARVPRNPIGWLLLAMGVALGVMLPVNLLVASAHESLRPATPLVIWAAWARTAFATPLVLGGAVVAVQLFPDGRPLPGRWRVGLLLGAVGGVGLAITTAVDPVGLITYPSIANPMALPYATKDAVSGVRTAAVLLIIAAAVIAVASLWLRYRRGDEILRAQLRWILLAVAVTIIAAIPFVVSRYVLRVTDSVGEVLSAVAQISACAFPLAAAIAISRYRLFDVDVVIGRTLVYLPLMAVAGGMYTAGVALFQRLFMAVTGSESDVAIVMAILVVASVFTQLRHGLESHVNRRFPTGPHDHDRQAPRPAAPHRPAAPSGLVARPSDAQSLLRPTAAATAAASRSAGTGGTLARAQLVKVHPDGRVDCPMYPDRTLIDCLGCPRLLATAAEPEVTIVCRAAGPD